MSSSGNGEIYIGRNVHIAINSSLIGQENILISDFANISSRVAIYSSSDDFSGDWMTNPTIPERYTNVYSQPVLIGKHVIIGTGSTILPGVQLSDCCAVGAMSLVKNSYPEFTIVCGVPSRKVGFRNDNLLQLENDFNND
ncbi:acyltransferase [Photobacterium leiognathi]|uniref:acyltransferase n=1 Tax=Photobacterium leiognathi TaxID=553611 RepID=UPI0027391F61|nr:acyltransferase [Photobacterium leiognathi]